MKSVCDELDLNLKERYNLDQFALDKLNLNNKRILEGNEEIYETPITKSNSVSDIIEGWDKVFNSNLGEMNDVLVSLEEKQKSKVLPRSQAVSWEERKSSLDEYFKGRQSDYKYMPEFHDSGPLRPISISKAIDFLKNNTSAGLSSMLKKGDVKIKFADISYFKEQLALRLPCILYTRTQEGMKTRNVWGFPMVDSLNEMTIYIPIQRVQKKKSYRAALLGPEYVDKEITRLIDFALARDLTLVSIDFTAYDASITNLQIHIAFSYFRSLFQKSFHSAIDYMEERFRTIGIVTPFEIFEGDHGTPSGSTLTNEVGSVIQYYVYEDTGLVYMEVPQCQGDDGALAVDDENVDKLFDSFEKYGLEINKSKSTIAKDWIVFLQNLYHVDYRDKSGIIGGIYPTYRALCRLVYQERWADFEKYGMSGQDYYSLRALQILENCKYHPIFEDLCLYYWSIDKYNVEFSDEGLSLYVDMVENKEGKSGIVENQYGDKLYGIRNFESYKLMCKFNKQFA
jgi:hypothetical protein